MIEQNVLYSLKEKYNIEFDIQSSEYIASADQYQFVIQPKNKDDITFITSYDKKSQHIHDTYIDTLFQKEASDYFSNKIRGLNIECPIIVSVNQSYEGKIQNLSNIPSWKTLYEENPEEFILVLRVNLFSEIDDEILSKILNLDQSIRSTKHRKVGFSIQFFMPESITGKDLVEINFGYSTSPQNFEYQYQKYFLGKLRYYIDFKNLEITMENLKSILSDQFMDIKFSVL